MQRLVRRGDADEAVRVAAPCRTRPSADSSAAPPANRHGRSSRARVLYEAVLSCRANGLFEQTHCIRVSPFETRDLGADQRGAVREILGAVLRPHLELLMMGGQHLQMAGPLPGGCRV